jgi:hypothetical protein
MERSRKLGRGNDGRYFETGYPVEFQLKGTSVARVSRESIGFDLAVRNYNLIVSRKEMATPYYLFLVCFGPDVEEWADVGTDALRLNASAYWWRQAGPGSENARSVRIEIPASNRLTPRTVADMLRRSQEKFAT